MTTKSIGGPGKIVEFAESQVATRMHHRGRNLNEIWVFGGIKQDTKIFIVLHIKPVCTKLLSKESYSIWNSKVTHTQLHLVRFELLVFHSFTQSFS